jgi:hypothetical protein
MLPKRLKGIVVATPLLLCLAWVTRAPAGQVQLAWDATTTHTDGTPATDLAGYHLYYWQGNTGTPKSVDVGNTTTYTLTALVDGATYSLAVAAYNTSGVESSYSNTITVTLPSILLPPQANNDTASSTTGTPVSIAVLANDSDPYGYPLTITAVTQGAHGTATISGTSVIYTPAAGFVGTDSFTYTITDGQSGSATATVTVNVMAGNLPPVAVANTVSISAGTSATIAVLANDSDPYGYALTISSVTQGAHGTVTISGTSVTYTPAADFVGTDSFTYTITDGYGHFATAPVTVAVLPDRTASLVAAYSFNEGSGTTVSDSSGNGNTGTISAGPVWSTQGKFGSALSFTGSGNVSVPHSPTINLTSSFTLSAWIKPTALSGYQTILIKETTSGCSYWLQTHGNQVNSGFNNGSGCAEHQTTTANLPLNAWSYLTAVFDAAAHTYKIYVNGNLVSSQTETGTIQPNTQSLVFGQSGCSSCGYERWRGLIDEVRIYNEALLPSEIQADMVTPIQ